MWLSSPLLSPPRLVAPIWGFAIKFHIWRLTPTSLSTFPASSSMRIPFQRFNSSNPRGFQILSSNPSCIKVEVMVGKKLWIELTYEILRQRWTPEVSFVKSQSQSHQWNLSLNLRRAAETTYRPVAAIGLLVANTAMMTALRRPWSIGWWRW